MLLVLSSILDQYAAPGVAHWRAKGATAEVITCHDLAQPGWKLSVDDEPPTLVVAGKPIAAKDIEGVVSRLANVTSIELPFIHVDDRDYAASEFQAFLLALLSSLPCPVLNAPTPGCLNGPAWAPEQWTRCAARAGIAVKPITRRTYAGGLAIADEAPPDRRVLHVVGDDAFGDGTAALKKSAVAIAKAAGVELLRVAFDVRSKPVFLDADPWVDMSDKAVAEAIRKRLAS
jgi:hypothetical protein